MGCIASKQPRHQQARQRTAKHQQARQITAKQCNICLENINKKEKITALSCAHIFHTECLLKAYTVNIYQRNFPIKCPDCNTEVDYYIMKNILSEVLFTLYEKILLINVILLDQHRFFCPTPDCPAIYEIIPSEFRYFQCIACNKQFCLVCHKKYHGKTQCVVQTKQQIAAFSVECPKCKADWFKITGCNHVQCKVCHHKFCYKCKGPSCGSNNCKNSSNQK